MRIYGKRQESDTTGGLCVFLTASTRLFFMVLCSVLGARCANDVAFSQGAEAVLSVMRDVGTQQRCAGSVGQVG